MGGAEVDVAGEAEEARQQQQMDGEQPR